MLELEVIRKENIKKWFKKSLGTFFFSFSDGRKRYGRLHFALVLETNFDTDLHIILFELCFPGAAP